MKIRTVTVIYLTRLPVGGGADPYQFDMVIPDHPTANFDPRQLLGLVGGHPEDPEPEPGSPQAMVSEYVRQMGPLLQQMSSAHIITVPPGTLWHDGCVEFQTPTGETIVVPLDGVARIQLGPVRDAP